MVNGYLISLTHIHMLKKYYIITIMIDGNIAQNKSNKYYKESCFKNIKFTEQCNITSHLISGTKFSI